MSDTAVLLCGHGSRDPEAVGEFEHAAAGLRPRLPEFDFATGVGLADSVLFHAAKPFFRVGIDVFPIFQVLCSL